jgi:hypothetical protein
MSLPFVLACGPRTHRVLMAAENNSAQSGFAILTALSAGETKVELDIASSDDARPQPAHVHDGRCGEIGVIRAPLAPLQADARRSDRFVSTTEIGIGLEQLLKGPYAINVHDVRDLSLYVSCGQIP